MNFRILLNYAKQTAENKKPSSSFYIDNTSYLFYEGKRMNILNDLIPLFKNVKDMSYMFYDGHNVGNLPLFDTSSVTNMSSMFYRCINLSTLPLFDTKNVENMTYTFASCNSLSSIPNLNLSNATNLSNMFRDCRNLQNIPIFNIPKVTNLSYMFFNCSSLTDESLNNIMAMCISATSYARTKTLATLQLTSAQATRCQGLSNYQDFVNAGWSTGY